MKIFVTGGGGFIGKHAVKELLNDGNKVTIYDNLENSSKEDITKLRNDGVEFINGDILNYKLLSRAIKGFDSVVHLAAKIDVQESIKNPELTHAVNVTGTMNVLLACVKTSVRNVIAASSAAVYGEPLKQPISENSPTNPISPYGASKLSMEFYLKAFSRCYNLNCISLRFFNVYGEGQTSAYAGVITKFIESIQNDHPPIIFGDGRNTRDFVSVKEVSRAIRLAIKKIKHKKGDVYNIGSGKQITINELAKMMLSISHKSLSIRHIKSRKGDIRKSQPVIKLAKNELGYTPTIDLKTGLEELIN
mgnify:CR=1 FL=1